MTKTILEAELFDGQTLVTLALRDGSSRAWHQCVFSVN